MNLKTNWQAIKLGDVCEIVGGGTPSTKESEYWGDGYYWVTPKDLGKIGSIEISETSKLITENGLKNSSAKLLPVGSVILSSRAPIGYVAINTNPMATNQGCRSFLCGQDIYNKYLYHFLIYSHNFLQTLGSGSTFLEVSGSRLKEIEIPLPPLAEQKRIVAKIEKQLAKIDEAARLRAQSEALTAQLLPATLHEIFSSAESKGWEEKELNEIARVINGRAYKQDELLDEGKYPVLRVGNFFTNRSWYYSDLELDSDKYCDNGDLLYAWSASFGPRIWSGKKVIFHYHIWKIEPSELIDKYFLYYLLEARTKQMKEESGKGATMSHLTKGNFEKIKIPVPPLTEQKAIVKKLDALSKKARALRDLQSSQAADLKALKQSILHEAFSGDFVEEKAMTQQPIPSPYIVDKKKLAFYRNQVNAAIVDQVATDGGATTEVAVAKYNHLLQEMCGVSLDYEFAEHKFGPFDAKIKKLIWSGLGNNKWFAKDRGNVVKGKNIDALLAKKSNLYWNAKAGMERLSDLGITKLDVNKIELLSTVYHSIKQINSTDLQQIRDFMSNWQTNGNQTKADKFTDEQTKKCIDFIVKNKLYKTQN